MSESFIKEKKKVVMDGRQDLEKFDFIFFLTMQPCKFQQARQRLAFQHSYLLDILLSLG